ncbi:SDR family NAD(P)-dependent oxidoreductase [Ramlibacter albus]|uniref:SDR family NAD(P)-dependent oxidoreductase n=1 Tax=Ramlibacter albus TaxID=2079448 RepID=A0A923S161_9BURK|nr:SDR family NAD(P)-dependent oxidoreductase [Ramlibacter albus]MBC5763955.1 SDR family NAD(P)-dependent oxidoreductase [Ramlibacter albus]
MKIDLGGKAVVVTGGAGAIGRGIAIAMARAGASVVVNDIGVSLSGESGGGTPADSVVETIRAAGGKAVANSDSVSTWQGAHKVIAAALDNFGRIDAVINNAGTLQDRMFFRMSEEEWRSVIDVHLRGTFFISRGAAPHFKDQESGAFIHMTSTSGLIGNLGQANYSAAKLGVVALSKSIALDMERFNVRSNCIAPFAWSRMTNSLPTETEEQRERVARFQKMEADKIAPMAVFLASEQAKDVNAQVFAVRANEIMLMGQARPLRSVHTAEGWTPEAVAQHAIPALRPGFYPLHRSSDVISWDPV